MEGRGDYARILNEIFPQTREEGNFHSEEEVDL